MKYQVVFREIKFYSMVVNAATEDEATEEAESIFDENGIDDYHLIADDEFVVHHVNELDV